MTTTRLLTVIAVLQGLILLGQWTSSGPVTPAWAQIPDAGGQRGQIIEELKSLNAKVDKLADALNSGKIQVHVAKQEDDGK
jgi:outer membrane murein-binding lipoprotein Lpp